MHLRFSHRPAIGAVLFAVLSAPLAPAAEPASPAGNAEVQKIMETFAGQGVQRDNSKPLPPAQAVKSFTLRPGLAIDLIAAEPEVRQPVYISFDSRGRPWITQYLQYQYPAGLKVVSYDQHLRAQFDKVPEPPPRGVKGADIITVLEDKNADGTYASHRDVLTGLNIATAAIKGAGGIWVMNPPYLLFYPDANDDDIPDGDPKVCLSGFGLEDTHSVASSLMFGPDGWIYGAVGSTTTGNVSSRVTKNVRFVGQHIWRYHPKTEVFELFAEGGGNTFSCEIDAQGRVFSGTNGSPRGMHYDQGMAGTKNFGKHGYPDNPYAFGYFDHLETKSDGKRFSQAFCVYDGDLMAEELGGKIVAPNAMQNMVYVSPRIPDTSTFRVIDEAPLLRSSDRWFRPVDVKVGPDGGIWLADWYDTRLSHVSPVDDWSKNDGRIYRVRPAGAVMSREPFDLHRAPVAALLAYLDHPNKWFRRQAALELAWRDERAALPQLIARARDGANPHAFDALCALQMLGGLSDPLAVELLRHPDPYVRRWVIRCSGDEPGAAVGPSLAAAAKQLAATENQPEVRVQLLATARRWRAADGLPIVDTMMRRGTDLADKRIPLMLWWALESKAESDRAAVLALFEDAALWDSPLARAYGARNLARRWALAGGPENFEACARLFALAHRPEDRTAIIEGLSLAFEGRKIPALPPALARALDDDIKSKLDTNLALAVKAGQPEAVKKALAVIADNSAVTANRAAMVQALAEAENRAVIPAILRIFDRPGNSVLKREILPLAAKFDEPALAKSVLQGYETRFSQDPELKDAAHRMLASRHEWAKQMLVRVDRWEIRAADVAPDVVRQLELYDDPGMAASIRKNWPPSGAKLSSGEKLAELKRLKAVVATRGDPARGQAIFAQRCAGCHTLFGDGGKVGPELTGYERNNPDFWLVAILDPSLEIREGFNAYVLKLRDGQTFMGMMVKQDAASVVLRDVAGQEHSVKAEQVASLDAYPKSLMPEGLLGGTDDAMVRDLFAYLMKP